MTIVIGALGLELQVNIYVMCECGQEFETSASNAGKTTLCPICSRVLTLPRPAAPQPPPEIVQFADEPLETQTSRAAIASLVLGGLFFFACLSGLPAILLGRRALRDIRWSGGQIRGKWMAECGIVLGVVGCLFTVVLPPMWSNGAREPARRAQCTNNLKQIGLAMHNYHSAFDCLPPATITDKNGKPLLSWRVAILPFYDASGLYAEFHLDEPWDSPHNLSLLARMPNVFQCPSDTEAQPGMTKYQVIVGPNTAFPPDFKPLSFDAFVDGTASTILAIESRHAVPWTKPEDVPIDMMSLYAGLGDTQAIHGSGFNVLMGDGSVRFLKNSVNPDIFRAFSTRNGCETCPTDRDPGTH